MAEITEFIELKRCPFCKGNAVLSYGGEHFTIPECTNCGAKLPAQFGEDSEAKAIAAWNTRAEDTHTLGHWIAVPQPDCELEESKVWQCSVCGNEWQLMEGTPEENDMNYCQQCGASMNVKSIQPPSLWLRHEDSNTWECSHCHACVSLDKGTPKDKYLNYCPVCGSKLELPD